MNTFPDPVIVSIAGLAMTMGAVLVKLGRIIERQSIHTTQIEKHEVRIDELEDGHSSHNSDFVALRGEMTGLKTAMEGLGATLRECITRLDSHLAK